MPFGYVGGPGKGFGFHPGLERYGGARNSNPVPVRQAASSFQGSSDTSLSVVTAEGDRITISLQARAELSQAAYRGPDGTASASLRSVSSEIQVNIEGDLSEDELRDLKRLFHILGKAQQQAQSSGGVDIERLAHRLSRLDSVASFDYSHEQTIQAGILEATA